MSRKEDLPQPRRKAKRLDIADILVEAALSDLFEKIKHGDEAHRAWLKNAIEAFAKEGMREIRRHIRRLETRNLKLQTQLRMLRELHARQQQTLQAF